MDPMLSSVYFDTRIWPERCSFSDKNLGPVTKRWKGTCEAGKKFSRAADYIDERYGGVLIFEGRPWFDSNDALIPTSECFDSGISMLEGIQMLQFRHPCCLRLHNLRWVEDRWRELHTTHSPQFLGLLNQRGLWLDSDYGSDVIVGVFDTRIWPEQCSFSDKNLGPVPKRWKGTCEAGKKFSVINCNWKLIGARFFIKGHKAFGASSGVPPITLMNDTVEY
ncbi:hypothetical protein FH972_005854 [Carpinus fangiana]|uniref:Uncharacterized protein n=1 Tax=Carpinus fangiana TaxID=176857 RepID=A0A5N6QQI6_9ROSI|nr:hypothetical protein FH972_005854 [Carpinus fangiana]